jgi:hypothetical protein
MPLNRAVNSSVRSATANTVAMIHLARILAPPRAAAIPLTIVQLEAFVFHTTGAENLAVRRRRMTA